MDYSLIFNCMDIILASIAVLFFLFYWFRVVYVILAFTPTKKIPKTDKLYHYNILIPARNESKVIGNILASIKNQSYDQSYLSVYVIVESEDDPTIQITKSYGYNSIVRKHLEGKRTKGYALREAIDYLNANNITCDAYMIFDADNVLEKNFITRINRLK